MLVLSVTSHGPRTKICTQAGLLCGLTMWFWRYTPSGTLMKEETVSPWWWNPFEDPKTVMVASTWQQLLQVDLVTCSGAMLYPLQHLLE